MTARLHSPRTLDYFVLRTCERLHMSEAAFHALTARDQYRLLAYERLRSLEQSAGGLRTAPD